MTAEDFIATLTEIMNTNAVLTLDTELADVKEWDSLSLVLFLSHCNVKLKIVFDPDEIKSCETVKELFKLVCEKL